MFTNRWWPEGFEFPSCGDCNHGSSNDDLLISFLARMDPGNDSKGADGMTPGIIASVKRQIPDFFDRMLPSASDARRKNREIGLSPLPGQTHQETGVANVPIELHKAVCVFSRKLAKGIFYKEVGSPFPSNGGLFMNWFTNAEFIKNGSYPVLETLKEMGGDIPALKRGKNFLNGQFEYKFTMSVEREVFVLQAVFGLSFGFVVFGSSKEDFLEDMFRKKEEETGKPMPFVVLQSPYMD